MMMPTLRLIACIPLAAALLAGGCKDDQPETKTLTLAGTVEQIDLPNRKVKISFFSDKHGRNLTQEVGVTDQTEVFINGIAAKLEDVRVGESADGEVSITRDGERKVFTITKVQVRRAETISATPASVPAAPPPAP